MAVATRDLTRITVDTPQRRLDVAVPSNVPVADLLLAFVRAGGERLADAAASGGSFAARTARPCPRPKPFTTRGYATEPCSTS